MALGLGSSTRWIVAVLVALGLGVALGRASVEPDRGPEGAPAASPSDSPAAPPAGSTGAAGEPALVRPVDPATLEARAEEGELEALKRLELSPPAERSVSASLALARGHEARLRASVASLVAIDAARRDPAYWAALDRASSDPRVAIEAMGVLAALDEPSALDLLFAIRERTAEGQAERLLAEDLLAAPTVRARATSALGAILAMDAAAHCYERRAALVEVERVGDARVVTRLEALGREDGCGDDGRADCNPCLRGRDELDEALEAARARPFAPPWAQGDAGRSKQQRKPIE